MSLESETEGESTVDVDQPTDVLAGAPETAYFWGYVAGAGDVRDDGIEITTSDEPAAQRLATIAGAETESLEHETSTREYAHDASIVRTDDEYTVSIEPDADGSVFGRASTLGFPVDGRGNYAFTAFVAHDRELLRGLLEGCGTVCFKSSSGTVGISFVHDDRVLLEAIETLVAACPVEAPTGDIGETSSGGYWFGVDDDAAADFGSWLYEGCVETNLFAPSRRRKLRRSLEEADAYGEGSDDDSGGRTDGEERDDDERGDEPSD